jgi:DNA-binding transcriptional LysR family regulator
MAFMLPERHPLARRRRIALPALAREPLILFPASPRPSWVDTVIAACRAAGFEPRVAQEAMESATVVSFVAAGVGIAVVPEGLKVLARPGVVFRLAAPPAPVTHLAAVHRSGELAPAVQRLMELVRELW